MIIEIQKFQIGDRVAVVHLAGLRSVLYTIEGIRYEVSEDSQSIWYKLSSGHVRGNELISVERLAYIAEQCRLVLQSCAFFDFPQITEYLTSLISTANRFLAEIEAETKKEPK